MSVVIDSKNIKNIVLVVYENEPEIHIITVVDNKVYMIYHEDGRFNTNYCSKKVYLTKDFKAHVLTTVERYIHNPANHYKIMGIFENSAWSLKIK